MLVTWRELVNRLLINQFINSPVYQFTNLPIYEFPVYFALGKYSRICASAASSVVLG